MSQKGPVKVSPSQGKNEKTLERFYMEQVNFFKKDNGFEKIAGQANAWGSEVQAFQRSDAKVHPNEYQQTVGRLHACRASQREFQQARDRLKRANRDLGETAAFIAATLTTATAVQAVIGFAHDQLGLPREFLQLGFLGYILVIVLIVGFGTLRVASAMYRRKRAERELDRSKKGIFDYCPLEEWPKAEE